MIGFVCDTYHKERTESIHFRHKQVNTLSRIELTEHEQTSTKIKF